MLQPGQRLTCGCRPPLAPHPMPQGYKFYLGVFYVLATTLFLSVAICVWVGWCFMNDNFPTLWPIKVARVVVSVFVSMFYIAALNIFLIALQCDFLHTGVHLIYGKRECHAQQLESRTGGEGHTICLLLPALWSGSWPATHVPAQVSCMHAIGCCQILGCAALPVSQLPCLCRYLPAAHAECFAMPHLVHSCFSAICAVMFFVVAALLVVADHELEPMSTSLLAAPHSMCELRVLLCKTAITLVDILLVQYPKIQVWLQGAG